MITLTATDARRNVDEYRNRELIQFAGSQECQNIIQTIIDEVKKESKNGSYKVHVFIKSPELNFSRASYICKRFQNAGFTCNFTEQDFYDYRFKLNWEPKSEKINY